MDKLHRLFFSHRRVNLCSFKAMKLSPKFISAFVAILFALLLVACSKTSEESLADGKNVYRASYYLLELPEGFSVDEQFESNSGWNVRYIKDSFDNRIMSFYDGESTNHGKPTNKKCKEKGFMTFARLDSISLFNGAASVLRNS